MTRILTTTRVPVYLLLVLSFLLFLLLLLLLLVFLSLALHLLVFLPLTLPTLVFLPLALPSLIFLLLGLPFLVFFLLVWLFWFSYFRCHLLNSFTTGTVSIGPLNHGLSFLFFCSSFFSFPHFSRSGCSSYHDLNTHFHHANHISPSRIQVFRVILLLLEEDYTIQRFISLLKTSKKRL